MYSDKRKREQRRQQNRQESYHSCLHNVELETKSDNAVFLLIANRVKGGSDNHIWKENKLNHKLWRKTKYLVSFSVREVAIIEA